MSVQRIKEYSSPKVRKIDATRLRKTEDTVKELTERVNEVKAHLDLHYQESVEEAVDRLEDFENLEIDTVSATDFTVTSQLTTSALTASKPVFTNSSKVLTSSGTMPVNQGGSGQTTYTNGQLLIGNTTGSTLAKATLTAGNGVGITNSTGAITVDAEEAIMWAVLLGT